MDDHHTASEKRCTKCRVEKFRSEFPRRARAKDGLQAWCRACHSAAGASYYKQDPTAAQRNALRRLYGVDYDDVVATIKAQGGRCAICDDTFAEHWRAACVDHDHTTGRLRAIICRRCNLMLGQARDNSETLIKAAEYLQKHQ